MKAIRYMLIALGLVSVLSVSAQNAAQLPVSDFRSTSVMQGSGSALPQAAVTGAFTTGSTPGSYSQAYALGRPFRTLDGDDFEEEGEEPTMGKPGEPSPLGDALIPLALIALAYVGVRAMRRRRV